MSAAPRQRRVVIVGIPGVGKSTVVNELVTLLRNNGHETTVANYGTVMMEEASSSFGVKSRDEMRKLPVDQQKKMQIDAAEKIKHLPEEFVIVDTHLFIPTKEGYWPGMPLEVLQQLRPTNLILVSADPSSILRRREKDHSRQRDPASLDSIQQDLTVATSLLFASSLVCGSPALIVDNKEGDAAGTAKEISRVLGA